MHRAAAKPTSPPLVPACGFLIRRRSDSDTRNLRLTIDEDGWRAAPSCCLTRSRKITRVGTTRRVKAQPPCRTTSCNPLPDLAAEEEGATKPAP
jgi:hypothetical protein